MEEQHGCQQDDQTGKTHQQDDDQGSFDKGLHAARQWLSRYTILQSLLIAGGFLPSATLP
jgi:hypothetical protein